MDRIETLRRALIASLTADAATCELVLTSDVSWESPTFTASTRDEVETMLSSRAGALSDIDVVIDSSNETNDTVLAHWHATARHDRAFVVSVDTNLSPSGAPLALEGTTSATFTGARISAIRHDFDEEALLRQLRA